MDGVIAQTINRSAGAEFVVNNPLDYGIDMMSWAFCVIEESLVSAINEQSWDLYA